MARGGISRAQAQEGNCSLMSWPTRCSQRGASATLQAATPIIPADSLLEREAEATAASVAVGHAVELRRVGAQQLARDVDAGVATESRPLDAGVVAGVDATEYRGGGGEFGGGGASGSFDDNEQQGIERDTRVERVVVSCSDGIIIFETLSRTLIYRLKTCYIPVGSYQTTVTVHGNDVNWDFGEQAEGDFYFTYTVHADQDNPATLFESGQEVPIDVVPSWTVRQRSEQPACLVSIPQRVIIPGDRIERELFPRWEREITVWEHEIPLAEFGWADVSLVLNGNAEGHLSAGYGPGVLRDVCLVRRLDGDRIAGTASFQLPADFTAEVRLNGTARLAADYLSVIPVAAIEGALDATGTAHANNRLDARVDVIYDHVKNKWRFATEASVAGQALLAFTLDMRVAAELLSRTIWSERWNLVDAEVGFDWNGGIQIDRDLALSLKAGRIAPSGTAAAVSTSSQSGTGAGGSAGVSNSVMLQLAGALLAFGSGQKTAAPARRGLSRDDALAFWWHKPKDNFVYPERLSLPRAITPKSVDRDARPPTQVTYVARDGTQTFDYIGVADHYWPFVGKPFQLVPEKSRSDREKDRFRNLVSYLGYSRAGQHIDHVHELQFGRLNFDDAVDAFNNLWPIDSSANASAGTRHRNQLERYRQTLGAVEGRWFEIVKIGV